jgi:hypothetical protein
LFGVGQLRIKKARRLQRIQNDPLDRRFRSLRGREGLLDEALVILVADRAPERGLGKAAREKLEFVDAIRCARFRAGEFIQVIATRAMIV